MISGTDAAGLEMMREPVRSVVQLAVRESTPGRRDRRAVGHDIDNALEQRGQVERGHLVIMLQSGSRSVISTGYRRDVRPFRVDVFRRTLTMMCDTVVVVRDDAVLFAKNSDRDPNEAQLLEWHGPRHVAPGSLLHCTWIDVPDVEHTNAVVVSRPSGCGAQRSAPTTTG